MKISQAVVYFVLICTVLALCVSAADARYATTTIWGLKINTTDNVTLTADATIPNLPQNSSTLFPVLIFPNSWGIPEIEYIIKTINLAADGYVALEYQTRGWYFSGGEIDTAGPKDREDITNVIDFVERHAVEWNADMSKIAFLGISYGAGLSIQAAGHDDRVTTAVALSGWANITNLFYYHHSPNLDVVSLLNSGKAVGRLNQSLFTMFNNLLAHQHLHSMVEFCNSRSPARFLNTIKERNIPIFISNNFLDRLFFPQTMLDFFSELNPGYRFMLGNQGGHAFPEGVGLFDIGNNFIWDKVRRWLDFWLKGIPTGIMDQSPLQMQLGNDIFSKNYVGFTTWPDPDFVHAYTMNLVARGNSSYGGLVDVSMKKSSRAQDHKNKKMAGVTVNTREASATTDTIAFTSDPFFVRSHGDSDLLSTIGVPFVTPILTAPLATSTLYMLMEPLQFTKRLCGIPTLTLQLSTQSSNWQIFAYLYDVVADASNPAATQGILISDFEYTNWNQNWEAEEKEQDVVYTLHDQAFRALCREVPLGHQIALGFVLYSKHREPSNNATAFSLGLVFDGSFENSVTLPLIEV